MITESQYDTIISLFKKMAVRKDETTDMHIPVFSIIELEFILKELVKHS